MKMALTEKDYHPIAVGVEKILDRTKVLPENVFRQTFRFFLFITFDDLLLPFFFNHVKQYLLDVEENSFWLTAIDPDAKLYFGAHFDFFGTIEFFNSDTEDDYIAALNYDPGDSPADALTHNSNILMVFSPTEKWAIYGDRDADIAICAFTDREQMERFKSAYSSGLLGGVEAAADYAYGAGKSTLKETLCNSYPTN